MEERFVRGDKSRHIEGNGLGLAIAKSLTELQKGQMQIVVDGDLFKVILTFDRLNDPDPKTESEVVNGKAEKTDGSQEIQPDEAKSKTENPNSGDSEWI